MLSKRVANEAKGFDIVPDFSLGALSEVLRLAIRFLVFRVRRPRVVGRVDGRFRGNLRTFGRSTTGAGSPFSVTVMLRTAAA